MCCRRRDEGRERRGPGEAKEPSRERRRTGPGHPRSYVSLYGLPPLKICPGTMFPPSELSHRHLRLTLAKKHKSKLHHACPQRREAPPPAGVLTAFISYIKRLSQAPGTARGGSFKHFFPRNTPSQGISNANFVFKHYTSSNVFFFCVCV